MSEYRFTDGNLLVLYAVHSGKAPDGGLPDYIHERIRLGLETYSIIMKSRPDRHKTMVMIVGEQGPSEKVKEELVKGGVKADIIAIDSDSKNVAQTLDSIYSMVSKKPNPPMIYFVAPRLHMAVSSRVGNLEPAVNRPQLLWNVEKISVQSDQRR